MGALRINDVLVPGDVSVISANSLIYGWDRGRVEHEISWDIAYVSANSLRIRRNALRINNDARHDSLDFVWVRGNILEEVADLKLVQPDTIAVECYTGDIGGDSNLVWCNVWCQAGENGGGNRAASTTTASYSSAYSSNVCLECCNIIFSLGNQLVIIDR